VSFFVKTVVILGCNMLYPMIKKPKQNKTKTKAKNFSSVSFDKNKKQKKNDNKKRCAGH